ncbi:MAG: hypothetical protein M3Y64_03685 [Gemmatimonadota bacterium]|nr:hypothetical protein [Gemmatimonadota bacterium]
MTTASSGTAVRARAIGIVRGRDIDEFAEVSLDATRLLFAWENGTVWSLPIDALDGVMPGAAQLTLYLTSGDVLELIDNELLRTFATQLLERACTLPELTRGLRALGSQRGAPGPAHDKWFAPLLDARRAVAGVSDAVRQVALIDAARIAENMQRTITELAREQSPNHAAMERAIEAALLEESEATFVALARLALAADVLRESTLDTRLADWRRWVSVLREVFVAADQCWPRCAEVLTKGL